MDVGKLRHRVRLQRPGGSKDAFAGRVTSWTDVAVVWACVEPLTGRDAVIAAQRQASTSHKVTVRYSLSTAVIAADWRVLYDGRVLVVDNIINVEERNEVLELFCIEGLREE